jgi:hydroxymethylglutaryl-CoA reductase
MEKSSRLRGFYKLDPKKRLEKAFDILKSEQIKLFETGGLDIKTGDKLIENVIGIFSLPLSIIPNFIINKKNRLIPFVTEEPSVVAAASNGARIAGLSGGFEVVVENPVTTCQIQIETHDSEETWKKIKENENLIMEKLKKVDPVLFSLGGGETKIEKGEGSIESELILLLHVNVLDAMGANIVNTIAEKISPLIESLTGSIVVGKIVTNSFPQRKTVVKAKFPVESLKKSDMKQDEILKRFINLSKWALRDPQRAVTHNKGILNGISGVALATGNDFRAVEAACHFYAVKNGKYKPLSTWEISDDGNYLVGTLETPLPLASIGGMVSSHPLIKEIFQLTEIKNHEDLIEMAAACGLANNFSALWAISSEGIQKGHMKLHNRGRK